MERRKRYPDQALPEYRDGLPLYRCQVCGNLCEEAHLEDDGTCFCCQPGFEEEARYWTDAEREAQRG